MSSDIDEQQIKIFSSVKLFVERTGKKRFLRCKFYRHSSPIWIAVIYPCMFSAVPRKQWRKRRMLFRPSPLTRPLSHSKEEKKHKLTNVSQLENEPREGRKKRKMIKKRSRKREKGEIFFFSSIDEVQKKVCTHIGWYVEEKTFETDRRHFDRINRSAE